MRPQLSIWRNRDQEDEMHMTVFVDDQDYNRILEIQEAENLRLAEAYDKIMQEKKMETEVIIIIEKEIAGKPARFYKKVSKEVAQSYNQLMKDNPGMKQREALDLAKKKTVH